MDLKNKTILLTGGTGSFGQKFADIIFREFQPKSIRIFSRGEFLQYIMAKKFSSDQNDRFRFLIGDVRDKERLSRAMNGVDIVIHAAALKQILIAEYNPIEAVKTNILGTVNVIDAAIDNMVEKVILISTDKAVNPVNLYGATKLCAEKLMIQANSYTGGRKTRFAVVRYGNVLGSRGSIVPLFFEQKKKGALTITDMEMTRFWITLDQVVDFVISALNRMRGGEILIPKIPSVKIIDIARAIAPRAKIKFIGIRHGEKIHETLISKEEARHTKKYKNYFIIEPEHPFWGARQNDEKSVRIKKDFEYASNTNTQWLSVESIKKSIQTSSVHHIEI